jgi:acetyl esterase/lipase
LSILRSKNSVGGVRPAIYYIHGGGMIFGTRFFLLGSTFQWIKELDITLISVEYRLAPEHPDLAPVEDCYAGLQYVSSHTHELSIDGSKIIVAGGSAGAGLAAGVTLLARDRMGPKIFAQMLIYPMLDDRCNSTSSLQFQKEGTWLLKHSITGWDALLPGRRGGEGVSIYAAPARAESLKNLPQAYMEVGSCEPFRDEDVEFATRLWKDGVQAELHVWPGAWHAVRPA